MEHYSKVLRVSNTKGKQTMKFKCLWEVDWQDCILIYYTHPSNIYFRFHDYYNLHKAITNYNLHEDNYGTSEWYIIIKILNKLSTQINV